MINLVVDSDSMIVVDASPILYKHIIIKIIIFKVMNDRVGDKNHFSK